MGTYTSIFYHVVFSTKNRLNLIKQDDEIRIYSYIREVLLSQKCILKEAGGITNHIHLLFMLSPTKALSDILREIKCNTTTFIKNNVNSNFQGWQEGYSAFSISETNVQSVIHYINNQKEHHKKVTFEEELEELLKEFNIVYKKEYLLD